MDIPLNIGIFYDFDLTLSEEFQQYPIFRKYGEALKAKYGISRPDQYWPLCSGEDASIGWMEQFIEDAHDVFEDITDERMEHEFINQIELSPGIPSWFGRIKEFGKGVNLNIQHHVISSGIESLIRSTSVVSEVDSIYAGIFKEKDNRISGISRAVNPFAKIERIKTICKGQEVHADISWEKYSIQHENVFVIGDGQSDRDMFRYILQRGGIPIAVFQEGDKEAYQKAVDELGRFVRVIAPRNYSENSPLSNIVKTCLGLMKERELHCDMDPELIHDYRLGQVKSQELKYLAERHISACDYCRKSDEKMFFPS